MTKSLPAPERLREHAGEFAEMYRALRVESPAGTSIPELQELFNRYYRSVVAGGLHQGEERTDVSDEFDRQALKTFSAFENGRSLDQNDDAATKARRFTAWLNHLAATLGFQMRPADLYPMLLGRKQDEWQAIFATQTDFEQAIMRAYREITKLAEAVVVEHWVKKDATAALHDWPEAPEARREKFWDAFFNQVVPEIRRQWEANRSQSRDPQIVSQENAAFDTRVQDIFSVAEQLAERASDSKEALQLLNIVALQATKNIFSADVHDPAALKKQLMEAAKIFDSFHVQRDAWVPPSPPRQNDSLERAQDSSGRGAPVNPPIPEPSGPEPIPERSETPLSDSTNTGGDLPPQDEGVGERESERARGVVGNQDARTDNPHGGSNASLPPRTFASRLQQAEDWLRRWGNPFSYTGVNNKFTRLLFAPTIFVYGKVLPYFWRRPRYAAATVGGAVLGGISGGPVGAVVGASVGAVAGKKWGNAVVTHPPSTAQRSPS